MGDTVWDGFSDAGSIPARSMKKKKDSLLVGESFFILFFIYYYPKKQTARLVDRGVKHEKKSNLSNIRKKL